MEQAREAGWKNLVESGERSSDSPPATPAAAADVSLVHVARASCEGRLEPTCTLHEFVRARVYTTAGLIKSHCRFLFCSKLIRSIISRTSSSRCSCFRITNSTLPTSVYSYRLRVQWSASNIASAYSLYLKLVVYTLELRVRAAVAACNDARGAQERNKQLPRAFEQPPPAVRLSAEKEQPFKQPAAPPPASDRSSKARLPIRTPTIARPSSACCKLLMSI